MAGTQGQYSNPSHSHDPMLNAAAKHVGVFQHAMQSIWMKVAHERREANTAHGHEERLIDLAYRANGPVEAPA